MLLTSRDTVNSVPHFESRWLQRSKHPYTATSSAIIIRHAVAIDERRAKFRQDLIGETKAHHSRSREPMSRVRRLTVPGQEETEQEPEAEPEEELNTRYRRSKKRGRSRGRSVDRRRSSYMSNISPTRSLHVAGEEDQRSTTASENSGFPRGLLGEDDSDSDDEADEQLPQNIQEIWFPGCHADIGAGWPLAKGEEIPLSHGPLVWMVREAQKAGLRFDQEKVQEMKCGGNMGYEDEDGDAPGTELHGRMIPEVHITTTGTPTPSRMQSTIPETAHGRRTKLHQHLHKGATEGCMHDSLKFKNGTPKTGVLAWTLMEHLPFRRMDLQKDGSWKSINWPLPMGEVRDIPENAIIHNSAVRRMEADEKYRPGNLIIGGGGRGVRVAPKKYGIGEWEVVREMGDPVGECMVRKKKPSQQQQGHIKQNGASQAADFEKM
ncbi:hypothetical protein MMC10_007175 [Thelotrema lepadinum]|nr:hypothetical protein [Thelotrema lepadinum]